MILHTFRVEKFGLNIKTCQNVRLMNLVRVWSQVNTELMWVEDVVEIITLGILRIKEYMSVKTIIVGGQKDEKMRLIDADALKENHNMGIDCDCNDCHQDWKACQYDRVFL